MTLLIIEFRQKKLFYDETYQNVKMASESGYHFYEVIERTSPAIFLKVQYQNDRISRHLTKSSKNSKMPTKGASEQNTKKTKHG